MWSSRMIARRAHHRLLAQQWLRGPTGARLCSCGSNSSIIGSNGLQQSRQAGETHLRSLSSSAISPSSQPKQPPIDLQELYIQSEYSPGSPIFPPRGARLFQKMLSFMRAQYEIFGFEEVITPTIYKKSLWRKSGHWDQYANDMFSVRGNKSQHISSDNANVARKVDGPASEAELHALQPTEHSHEAAEDNTKTNSSKAWAGKTEEYGLKPMNCPGHCLIYKSKVRSFRDLPLRFAELSPLHRDEIHGALTGLTRVRRFHQDDGHIFCMASQIQEEISSTLAFLAKVYKLFNLPDYKLALSTRPDNFLGEISTWDHAESQLRDALDASGREWSVREGDGAFYGPKIDIILTDANGKTHQTATIQLDFQLPQRFNLSYIPSEPSNAPTRPVMIHRAIFGSLERFMALLIDRHQTTPWPFWLNPFQAIVLPLTSDPNLLSYAQTVQQTLAGNIQELSRPLSGNAYVEIDSRSETLSRRVAAARRKGYSLIVTVGPREMENNEISAQVFGTDMPDASSKDGKTFIFSLADGKRYVDSLLSQFR